MEKISAKEAKAIADQRDVGNTERDLKVCYSAIKRDAGLGLYKVILDQEITKKASIELRDNGYIVTILSGKTHIGWNCPREGEK